MPLPPTTAPLARVCLRDVAYAQMRDWIIDGTLQPEEPLRDEALAEALGMSRTPIREALQRLEDDGLVVTTTARRTFVSPVTLTQAREVFPIVAALEGLAGRLAVAHMDDAALDEMRAQNAHLAVALASADASAASAADTAFHAIFIARAQNAELAALLAELKSKVCRIERAFWGAADRKASVHDHEQLITAFAAHDMESIRSLLARNWERGLEWIDAARG